MSEIAAKIGWTPCRHYSQCIGYCRHCLSEHGRESAAKICDVEEAKNMDFAKKFDSRDQQKLVDRALADASTARKLAAAIRKGTPE